jgi:hypothetical protein
MTIQTVVSFFNVQVFVTLGAAPSGKIFANTPAAGEDSQDATGLELIQRRTNECQKASSERQLSAVNRNHRDFVAHFKPVVEGLP